MAAAIAMSLLAVGAVLEVAVGAAVRSRLARRRQLGQSRVR